MLYLSHVNLTNQLIVSTVKKLNSLTTENKNIINVNSFLTEHQQNDRQVRAL